MPKYPEGTVSPSGKYVVRGGEWVANGEATAGGPPTTQEGFEAQAESLPVGSPERERAINMATRLREPGAAGAALGLTGAMASIPVTAPAAKALAIYGAAEGAEKVLGLPSWVGEAVGLASPGKALFGRLLRGRFGGEAVKGLTKEAADQAAKRIEQEAEKMALRKRALDVAERRLTLAEQREARRAAGKATTATTGTSKPEPPSPDATMPATPTAQVSPPRPMTPAIPEDDIPQLVLALQQKMSMKNGPAAVKAFLEKQPPEIAEQLLAALSKRQSPHGYLGAGFTKSVSKMPTLRERGVGSELAKLLGQVQ